MAYKRDGTSFLKFGGGIGGIGQKLEQWESSNWMGHKHAVEGIIPFLKDYHIDIAML